MHPRARLVLIPVLLCLSGVALAEEAESSDEGLFGWSGQVDLGYLASSGNTETETLKFGADVNRTFGEWTASDNGTDIFTIEDQAYRWPEQDNSWLMVGDPIPRVVGVVQYTQNTFKLPPNWELPSSL